MTANTPRRHAHAASFLAMSCLGGALLAPASASAQQAPDAAPAQDQQVLGGMTVTSTGIDESGYKVDRLDSPIFTAPLIDTPRSVSVIPAELIKDTASATLTEALRTIPGITFGAGEGGNPLGDRPFIRGFDSQASTYLDGVTDIGAQTREVFDVEQIEVIKGSDSVFGGSSNAGGSINLVTKQPTAKRFVAVDGSYGSADYKRATVDINQPISDVVGVRLNAMYHDQNVAGRDAIFQKRWGIAPSVKFGLDGPTSLTLDYYHLHTNELPDSGIPYLYTLANEPAGVTETKPAGHYTTIAGQEVDVPRGAFYGLKDRDFRKTNVDQFTIRAEHAFDNGFKLRNTARYSHTAQAYVWTQPDDQQGNVYGTSAASAATAGGQVWRRINTRYGYSETMTDQADLSGRFDVLGLGNSIAATGQYTALKASNGSYVADAATGTAIATGSTSTPRCVAAQVALYNCTPAGDPNPNDPWSGAIVRSAAKTRTETNTTIWSASLFDTITVRDWLLFNLGGRYDHYETRVTPGLAVTAAPSATRTAIGRTDNLWTYQAGVVVKPASNGSIYFSTSTAATPPGAFLSQGSEDNALSATIDPRNLKVQKTTSYEVGTKWNLFEDQLNLTLALFQTKTTNARTTAPDGSLEYVGTRRIRGVEFGYNGNITPEWNIYGGYTYMPSKITNGGLTVTSGIAAPAASTGREFPNTPKHSFTAFTNYKFTPKLTIGGGAMYMSKVYGGYSDTRAVQNGAVVILKQRATYVPDYWRFDATASYQLTDAVKLQINANNLTNKRYFDRAYAAHYANQAAGRTVIGTIAVKF